MICCCNCDIRILIQCCIITANTLLLLSGPFTVANFNWNLNSFNKFGSFLSVCGCFFLLLFLFLSSTSTSLAFNGKNSATSCFLCCPAATNLSFVCRFCCFGQPVLIHFKRIPMSILVYLQVLLTTVKLMKCLLSLPMSISMDSPFCFGSMMMIQTVFCIQSFMLLSVKLSVLVLYK